MSVFPIDHDLHCHTMLSSCSNDPRQTVNMLLEHAKKRGYTVQCVTDHLWDSLVPGASNWYAPQDVAHVRQSLPLPQDDQVRMVFGCETEFCGGKKLALHESHYDDFDFIVIPPNHFHMKGFVRPLSCDTPEKIADLLVERLEEISLLDLPFEKVGIAHIIGLIYPEGDQDDVYRAVDTARFAAVMARFARLGAGIELNASCFGKKYRGDPELYQSFIRIAKEQGCKFYLASDSHTPEEIDNISERMPEVIAALGLTEDHLYRIPLKA